MAEAPPPPSSTDDRIRAALDLSRRLPPFKMDENLDDLVSLAPDLLDPLLGSVDQPLKILNDPEAGKEFLACEYNREGDSYRSPWTNKYYPPLATLNPHAFPSERLRLLESVANSVFEKYWNQYYGLSPVDNDGVLTSGLSSVYMWDLDEGFAAAVLFKNQTVQTSSETICKGCWDSIHVVEVQERDSGGRLSMIGGGGGGQRVHAQYKLTSSTLLWLESVINGEIQLGGSLMKQSEDDAPLSAGFSSHIGNIGKLIEEMENKIRSAIESIYLTKTLDIINSMRVMDSFQQDDYKTLADDLKDDLRHFFNSRVGPKSKR